MSQLFTIQEVAEQLATTPIAVMRLVARGALAGTRLGESANWRITSEELNRYVAAGAPDFAHPAWNDHGHWFAGVRPVYSNRLDSELREAAESQRKTAKQLQDLANGSMSPHHGVGGVRSIDIHLDVTPAIRAVFDGPADKQLLPGRKSEYQRLIDPYIIEQMQMAANQVLKGLGKLEQLYAGPETYRSIFAAAVAKFEQGRFLLMKDESRDEKQTLVTFYYLLSHKQIGADAATYAMAF